MEWETGGQEWKAVVRKEFQLELLAVIRSDYLVSGWSKGGKEDIEKVKKFSMLEDMDCG